jgi:hypothetical protein
MLVPTLITPHGTGEGRRPSAYELTYQRWLKERGEAPPEKIFLVEQKSKGAVKDKTPAITKKKKERTPVTPIPKTRVYPSDYKDFRPAGIRFTGPGSSNIIQPTPGYITNITMIVLFVDGETSITFKFGDLGGSGPIPVGGEGQPMGMVISHESSPARCGNGAFSIYSSGDGVAVSGYALYYKEKEIKPS